MTPTRKENGTKRELKKTVDGRIICLLGEEAYPAAQKRA